MADGPALTIPGVEGLEEIGRGGMAVVYKGHQPAFSRDVAVKVVVVAGVDERIRSRFEQELQAVGGLSEHPNIISVHGEGVTDQGLPYLIMGFQPGGTLSDQMRDRGPIPWAEVAAIGVKMAGALESAHRAGVLHRDVKPENILVSSFGEPVLADFGIARLEGGAHLTASGIITGTPAHTAPEVMQGRAPTAASDVYGLASTLHQLLSGTPAFVKATDESTLAVLNRFLFTPAVVANYENTRPLLGSILLECVLVVCILAVVAGWRFTPPPRAAVAPVAAPLSVHIHTDAAMFQVLVSPGKVGANDFVLQLMTGDAALLPAKEAVLILSLPERGIEPMERRATLGPDGNWHARGVALPQPGRWRMQIEALVTDFQKVSLESELQVQ